MSVDRPGATGEKLLASESLISSTTLIACREADVGQVDISLNTTVNTTVSTTLTCWLTHATLRADIRRTLRLALPLIGAQLLQIGNGLVDAVIAGRIGPAELAAGGIGSTLWFIVSISCIGLMAGLSPTLSHLIGQRRQAYVGTVFRQGLWLGIITGTLALALLLLIAANVERLPLAEGLPALISSYLYGACWSLPFFALVMASRNVCEATGLARPVLLVTGMGLVLNTFFNLVFGLGWFGFPALGLFGIGLSTTLVNISMSLVLLQLLRGSRFSRFALFSAFDRPRWAEIGPMLSLSVPIFLGMLFETGLFAATSIQMGTIGLLQAGAHQIAITSSAFCYMIPLGMSFALTARISRAAAQGGVAPVRLRVASGIILTAAMALINASALVLFRHPIAAIFTSDVQVQQFAASLLLLGALFQLSDAAQVMLIGVLRGLHDTRVPMLINAFSYWVVAYGFGLFCAYRLELGAHGLWVGLITGLSTASLLLALRLRYRLGVLARSSRTPFKAENT